MTSHPKRSPGVWSEKRRSGIEVPSRREIAGQLSEILAGTYTLLLKTHACHWNIADPSFLRLHKLTEHHYKNLFEATGLLAGRIRALGYFAPASFERMLPNASLREDRAFQSAAAMAASLVRDHERMAWRVRDVAAAADDAEDFATVDLLKSRRNFHEKAVWMLGAMMEG